MNKKVLIISIIVFILLLIIGIVIFFVLRGKETEEEEPVVALTTPPIQKPPTQTPVVVSTVPPPSSQTIPPTETPPSNVPVDATCLNDLDPSYYSFAEESVLGKDLIGSGSIERFAFERFALSGTNFIDPSQLDPNKYYKIGTLSISNTISPAQNGGIPCPEFPKVIYKEDLSNSTKFYYNAPCSNYTNTDNILSLNCVTELWSTAGCLTSPSVAYNLNNFNIPGTTEYNFTKSSLSTNISNYSQQNTFNPVNTPLCYSTNFMNWPFMAASSSINAIFINWDSRTTPTPNGSFTIHIPIYEGTVEFNNRYNTFALNRARQFNSVTYMNVSLPSGFTMDGNSIYRFPGNLINSATQTPVPIGFRYRIIGPSQSTNTNSPSLTFTFTAVGT
jgi:hypothetical protein